MRGIQAALTRVPYDGCQDERVGLMEMLRAYTAGGAWAAHWEGLTGAETRNGGGPCADRRRYRGDSGRAWAVTGIALTIAGGRVTHDPSYPQKGGG
jgi:hypothetical protein